MQILIIDDQQLVRLSVEKYLRDQGYAVTAVADPYTAISLLGQERPDLILLDINMPGMSGLEFIRKIQTMRVASVPVMILSGNVQEKVISEAFELGAVDYMKKPVSLSELAARVRNLLGCPLPYVHPYSRMGTSRVQEHCVGVVIPCYNEGDRLQEEIFQEFVDRNLGYHLCFVNDGSTDNTLEVLQRIRKGRENQISIHDCAQNGGKAEAVRQGMLHLAQDPQLDYIGFLDADLSTDFTDFDNLVQTLKTGPYGVVSGSRIQRMGANITKESARAVISKGINLLIRTILGMPFKDTQCGAKVMHRQLVPSLFREAFVTRWIFDVELFMRLRQQFGRDTAREMICELPLTRWIHADGSKLSMRDSLKIGFQLLKIVKTYLWQPRPQTSRTEVEVTEFPAVPVAEQVPSETH
ncbi:response regulator [Robiginitalea sp. M366]|uniref:response regulator n=1 Tax=Robiginitalea aestuariiviva TaxID=3036903 RepID=UPI00240CFFB0|nr:response regulator [Robiginitalea aestuariiviva]MDG1573362.1 response regulator [Robiginitalea aestuariiviva]